MFTRRLITATNTLAADDNDFVTPRYRRVPNGGTGERCKIERWAAIKVPNHPDSVHYFGAYSRLYWCDECESYQHPECHPCTAKPSDPFDSGAL